LEKPMISYLFRLLENSDPELAEEELLALGLTDTYLIEDDSSGEILLGGLGPASLPTQTLTLSLLAETKPTAPIDWHAQWAQFAQDFRDGKAHINLASFGAPATLLLAPGPGFGDLSHPTTYLTLSLMAAHVPNQPLLDIGCGSGILTLAALHLGASSAHGLDIDPAALDHARQNALLNHLPATFSLTLPQDQPPSILLMNMILPEQQLVMKEHKKLNALAKLWITSGILASQRTEYLRLTHSWGWKLVEERGQSEWCGFVHVLKKPR
jgi:ribosomal protein L11 methyltransferase